MGFLANAWNYGWTTGSIITKAEKEADRICKGIKTTILPDSEENEAAGCKIIFHPEVFRQLMGYDQNNQEENDNYESEVINGNFDTNVDSGKGEASVPEVYGGRIDSLDVKKNIAAAVNHFGIGNDRDIDIIRTQIAAILYISGLADADKVFNALNRDSNTYAIVNERVRMYTGEPMDERLIKMDIDKNTGDAVWEKLRDLTCWEMAYLAGRIIRTDEDAFSDSIMEAYTGIMNYLDQQGRRDEDVLEVIAAGGSGDVRSNEVH